jgi:hypothetical protein
MSDLKKSILDSPSFYEGVSSHKKNELESEVDKIIQLTEERIFSRKNGLQNWDTIKLQKLQQAFIEMNNKSKTDLNTLNLNQVTEILVQHIEMIPKFFDFCKENERKKEVLEQIKINAKQIAQEYLNRKNKEIKEKTEHEEMTKNLQNVIKAEEARYKEEEKRRKEAERIAEEQKRRVEQEQKLRQQEVEKTRNEINNLKKVIEDEKRRREEENRRRIEEENRRRREEENRRRIEEENRRRAEEENRRRAEEHRRYIDDLATKAINGQFGNGQARRNALGNLFNEVQNRVNERLGYAKRY